MSLHAIRAIDRCAIALRERTTGSLGAGASEGGEP
jgi:hypothetical protein